MYACGGDLQLTRAVDWNRRKSGELRPAGGGLPKKPGVSRARAGGNAQSQVAVRAGQLTRSTREGSRLHHCVGVEGRMRRRERGCRVAVGGPGRSGGAGEARAISGPASTRRVQDGQGARRAGCRAGPGAGRARVQGGPRTGGLATKGGRTRGWGTGLRRHSRKAPRLACTSSPRRLSDPATRPPPAEFRSGCFTCNKQTGEWPPAPLSAPGELLDRPPRQTNHCLSRCGTYICFHGSPASTEAPRRSGNGA